MKENFVQILVVVVEVSVDLRFSKYWELNIPFLGCTTAYRHRSTGRYQSGEDTRFGLINVIAIWRCDI